MRAFLFGLGGLAVLALIQFWPRNAGIWLVQMPPTMPPAVAVSQLLSTSVRLIDATDGQTFIVKANASLSPADLYRAGALVVLQASFASGCNPPENVPVWAKTEYRP